MVKQEIIGLITRNHEALIRKIDVLSDTDFMKQPNGKWTAGQQLEHI